MIENNAVGRKFIDKSNNRIIKVLRVGGNGYWFRYEDEPDGTEWTCCFEDFHVWDRFEEVK